MTPVATSEHTDHSDAAYCTRRRCNASTFRVLYGNEIQCCGQTGWVCAPILQHNHTRATLPHKPAQHALDTSPRSHDLGEYHLILPRLLQCSRTHTHPHTQRLRRASANTGCPLCIANPTPCRNQLRVAGQHADALRLRMTAQFITGAAGARVIPVFWLQVQMSRVYAALALGVL